MKTNTKTRIINVNPCSAIKNMSNIKVKIGIELGKRESINSVNRAIIKKAHTEGNYRLEGITLIYA